MLRDFSARDALMESKLLPNTFKREAARGAESAYFFFFFKGVSRKTRHQQPRIHLTNPKTQSQDTQTVTAAECARCCARLAAQQRLHRAHGDEAGSQGDAADDLLSAVHSSLSNVYPSWPALLTNTGLLTHQQVKSQPHCVLPLLVSSSLLISA